MNFFHTSSVTWSLDKQTGIAPKLVLLMPANLCFYLGASGVLEQGILVKFRVEVMPG